MYGITLVALFATDISKWVGATTSPLSFFAFFSGLCFEYFVLFNLDCDSVEGIWRAILARQMFCRVGATSDFADLNNTQGLLAICT